MRTRNDYTVCQSLSHGVAVPVPFVQGSLCEAVIKKENRACAKGAVPVTKDQSQRTMIQVSVIRDYITGAFEMEAPVSGERGMRQ